MDRQCSRGLCSQKYNIVSSHRTCTGSIQTQEHCSSIGLPECRDDVAVARALSELSLGFIANSKYKIQALFKDFQGPKLHLSSTKIIDKKPYPRHGHSQFRLQCDTEVYRTVLTNTVMIKASDRLSTNAEFQNLQDLNSRTFQGFSSTFKHLICFQALSRALK